MTVDNDGASHECFIMHDAMRKRFAPFLFCLVLGCLDPGELPLAPQDEQTGLGDSVRAQGETAVCHSPAGQKIPEPDPCGANLDDITVGAEDNPDTRDESTQSETRFRKLRPEEIPKFVEFLSKGGGWIAAGVLARSGDHGAIDALIKALSSQSEEVQEAAASALAEIGNRAAADTLMMLAHSRSKDVRASACAALGKLEVEEAVPLLIERLSDSCGRVRSCAADALAEVPSPRASFRLLDLTRDPEEQVRFSAIRALGRIGDRRARDAVIKTLKNDADANVRASAAEALGNIGDRGDLEALISALKDDDRRVPPRAAEAIGRIGDPMGARHVLDAMERGSDGDDDLAHSSTAALILLKDLDLVPRVRGIMKCADDMCLRLRAALVLHKWTGSEEAFEFALNTLDLRDVRWVRSKAYYVLGEMGDSRAIPRLWRALDDELEAGRCGDECDTIHTAIALFKIAGQEFGAEGPILDEWLRRTCRHGSESSAGTK